MKKSSHSFLFCVAMMTCVSARSIPPTAASIGWGMSEEEALLAQWRRGDSGSKEQGDGVATATTDATATKPESLEDTKTAIDAKSRRTIHVDKDVGHVHVHVPATTFADAPKGSSVDPTVVQCPFISKTQAHE